MNDQELQIRRMWVEKIIQAGNKAKGKYLHPATIADDVILMLPRFSHVATADLELCFEMGQSCMATTVDEFLEVWQVEIESRQREAEIAARQQQAKEEQLRLMSAHPVRDAIFAKWGFV